MLKWRKGEREQKRRLHEGNIWIVSRRESKQSKIFFFSFGSRKKKRKKVLKSAGQTISLY